MDRHAKYREKHREEIRQRDREWKKNRYETDKEWREQKLARNNDWAKNNTGSAESEQRRNSVV